MFDIGWQEIFIIGILALIVVGPKDLPQAVRTVSQWIRKARAMANEFQGGVNEMIREAELDDIKKQITDVKSFDLQSELEKNIDPSGEIADGLGLDKAPMDEEAEGLSSKEPNTSSKESGEAPSEGPIAETYGNKQSVPVTGTDNNQDEPDDDVMPVSSDNLKNG
ncbi:MAG: twin-arginine translocase subunit TatB [Rhodospirillaceae bacterium]|nr:twin-arginine translocase subunit TatB [Rhodospirillaceae bacterium]